ncbi:MAG: hypothetical protein ACLUHE_12750 [Christensenellales bacterium]
MTTEHLQAELHISSFHFLALGIGGEINDNFSYCGNIYHLYLQYATMQALVLCDFRYAWRNRITSS